VCDCLQLRLTYKAASHLTLPNGLVYVISRAIGVRHKDIINNKNMKKWYKDIINNENMKTWYKDIIDKENMKRWYHLPRVSF
jgi:hypothetical protein